MWNYCIERDATYTRFNAFQSFACQTSRFTLTIPQTHCSHQSFAHICELFTSKRPSNSYTFSHRRSQHFKSEWIANWNMNKCKMIIIICLPFINAISMEKWIMRVRFTAQHSTFSSSFLCNNYFDNVHMKLSHASLLHIHMPERHTDSLCDSDCVYASVWMWWTSKWL